MELNFITGGVADIIVHEKQSDGTLTEIHRASGGPWGSINVDQSYLNMLEHIFGSKAMAELRSQETGAYFDILREFETKKLSIVLPAADKITFRFSSALLEMSEKYNATSIAEKIKDAGFGDKVELHGRDMLNVDPAIVENWFDGPIDSLTHHMMELFREPEIQDVTTILLAGGFGSSHYVQRRLKVEFQNKNLLVPSEADLVVLKGAVRFGHEPSLLES